MQRQKSKNKSEAKTTNKHYRYSGRHCKDNKRERKKKKDGKRKYRSKEERTVMQPAAGHSGSRNREDALWSQRLKPPWPSRYPALCFLGQRSHSKKEIIDRSSPRRMKAKKTMPNQLSTTARGREETRSP